MWVWLRKHWLSLVVAILAFGAALLGLKAAKLAIQGAVRGKGDLWIPDSDPRFVWIIPPGKKAAESEKFRLPAGMKQGPGLRAKYNGPGQATVGMKNAKIDDI